MKQVPSRQKDVALRCPEHVDDDGRDADEEGGEQEQAPPLCEKLLTAKEKQKQ